MATKTLNTDGCEFGRMIKKDMDFLGTKITGIVERFDDTDKNITELFNHQSNRLPKEAADKMNRLYAIIGTIFGGVVVGLIVFLLTRV